jgi:hypothetical protein
MPDPVLFGSSEQRLIELHDAVKEVMGTLNYYIGPGARTAVGKESVDQYMRISHALARAAGEPCPGCKDTGIDARFSTYGPWPCELRKLAGHEHVEIPQEAFDYVAERDARARARDLSAEDAA